ncbi:ABC transporter ATP-binding protein [Clostridiaceae bacterium NSJ-31]|uniref:ABC transporter ATP-binding protein n=1 Tax=Ligaoa zhengdingensis TaxID=2763658 RepID=A0A926I3K7_9FIRM|nr:ABC transporter ATP-binding protein [Ligaoa zhengdingensis]MBC8545450.1 ABC transporter ATP-binding protein [Ligaoa zhengdingensis]
MSKNILKTEHVVMKFGGVTAVNDLSIEVNEGEIVALIGPNGAGKTTAFNVITGVYVPTSGTVYYEGKPYVRSTPKPTREERAALKAAIDRGNGQDEKMILEAASQGQSGEGRELKERQPNLHMTPDRITKLGIARTFQNIRLFKDLTVFENVLIAKHCRSRAGVLSAMVRANLKEEREMRRSAEELLEIVGLSGVKDEIASSLPYGQQRHLEIARALATEPKLLLLDEPAAGMNPQETDELTEFIRSVKDSFGLTVFMIEHHMDLVMEISDRIYVLDFGETIAKGTPEEIQNNQRVIDAYLGVQENA